MDILDKFDISVQQRQRTGKDPSGNSGWFMIEILAVLILMAGVILIGIMLIEYFAR